MKHDELVGFHECKTVLHEICSRSEIYKNTHIRPPHFLFALDAHEGRSYVSEYICTQFKEKGILPFTCGLKDRIEVKFNGTLAQMQESFYAIEDAALYSNNYENIISMELSALAYHQNDGLWDEFIETCERLCNHATLIFFVSQKPSIAEIKMVKKLMKRIPHILQIATEPYSLEELAQITENYILNQNVIDWNDASMHRKLIHCLEANDIHSIKQAFAYADKLIEKAEYDSHLLRLKMTGAMLNKEEQE